MDSGSLTDALGETLAVFEKSGEPLTTPEVAEHLDLGRRSTYARLERLVDQNRLDTKKVGANARVWWRPGTPARADERRELAGHTPERNADATDVPAVADSLVGDVLDDIEVGIFILDENTDVVWCNTAIERYFDLDSEQVVGRHKPNLIDEHIGEIIEDGTEFSETVLATYDDNTYVEQFECHVTAGENREERWLEHRSKPVDSGAFAGGRVELYYDVTDRKRAMQAHREDSEKFKSLIEAVEEYAIFTLDTEGRVQTWNPGAERIKGYEADEIVGEHLSVFYTDQDRADGVPESNLAAAASHGSVDDEGWRVRADGSHFWGDVTITAIREENGDLQGYAKVTRDMTDQREYERRLRAQAERLEHQRDSLESELNEMFERISDGFYALDEDLRVLYLNDHAKDVLGVDETAATADIRDVGILTEAFENALYEALETQDPVIFEDYYDPVDKWFYNAIYPSESGLSVYFRDVTERKRRQHQLSQFKRAVEASGHAIYMTDVEGEITYVNPAFEEITGYSAAEAIGATPSILQSGEHDDAYYRDLWETIRAGEVWEEEITDRRKNGELYEAEQTIAPVLEEHGEIDRFVAIQKDITERVGQKRELQTRIRQQAVVADLGQRAVETDDLDALMARATERVAEALDNDYCKVLDLDVEAEELLLRQGVGWHDGIVGEATVSSVEHDSQAAYTLAMDEPVVVEDLATEPRFSGPDLLTDHDVKSGISTIVGPPDDPWGILGTHDTERTSFSEQDVNFVQSVANILASAIDRHGYEQKLLQRREELAALNNLNQVISEITDAVIDQSTREEIEATVCEHLADTDSYLLAWIGDVDATSQTVNLRTEAGAEGYLDDVTISVDPDDEQSEGPTGRAFRTGEMQTTLDILNEPDYEPWRETAFEHGFRSSAAVPIVHSDTVYAVLNVYAERPYAFEGPEKEILAHLGEVVGHAISAAERKRALMSDELVELEFQIQDVFTALDIPVETDGPITFDDTVPVSDDEFLVYGTAPPDAIDAVNGLVEALSHWGAVTVRSRGDPTTFELRLTDPPVLSAVASLGGYVDSAAIEGGDYQMTIHLAPGVDVRQIIDVVEKAYPNARMRRRQQVTRTPDDPLRLQRQLVADLTDRQRAALDAAYHAGFFEWPRDATGEEVAESLDIAPPTFHQHLRKAEQKVLDSMFAPRANATE